MSSLALTGSAGALTDPIYRLAGTRIPTRPLRIGIFDDFVRGTAGTSSLIGARTPLPSHVSYHDWCLDPARVDAVLTTVRNIDLLAGPISEGASLPSTVVFLHENRTLHPHPPLDRLALFDLVLTNDFDLLDRLPSARWCSLIGTQVPPITSFPEKRELVSILDSGKRTLPGHRLRAELAVHPIVHSFGSGTPHGHLTDKRLALVPYYFNLAIESEDYDSWITEKLIDCFSTLTLPIYYGPLVMLPVLGFDPLGVFPILKREHTESFLTRLPNTLMEFWEDKRRSRDHNYRRALELYAPEVLMDALIRDTFGIAWD